MPVRRLQRSGGDGPAVREEDGLAPEPKRAPGEPNPNVTATGHGIVRARQESALSCRHDRVREYSRAMGFLRDAGTRLMSTGVLSVGWYSILTGLAMLCVAYLLGSVSPRHDAAAPFVAVAFAVTGLWQLGRGFRTEYRRAPESTDVSS